MTICGDEEERVVVTDKRALLAT